MYVGNVLISLGLGEMVQILFKERAFWHAGAGAASQREVVPFVPSLLSYASLLP